MVNHGIATGALFMLVGVIYDRRHTREVSAFGGLAKVMPVYATLFVIVTMASIGVPGTNGFVGEFMIIAGTYVSERLNQFSAIQAVGAAFGVILAAVYMLGVVQKMFFGPITKPENEKLTDITPREGLALAPLVVMIFVLGWFPALLLDRMEPSVNAFAGQFRNGFDQSKSMIDDGAAQLLPANMFHEGFLDGAPGRAKPAEPVDDGTGPTAGRGATAGTAPSEADAAVARAAGGAR
jgi:NADH-quinone oxidoreductase subunit M